MQTIGQKMATNHPLKLDVEWTFTNMYSDEVAITVFEEQIAVVEKLEVITQEDIDQLQEALNSLFLTKTDNYWYGQARLNTLATRLLKQPKTVIKELTYPITLNEFDDMAIEIDMNHEYFSYGKTAREWMKHWLLENNHTTFENEASIQEKMALAASAFKEFWSKFQSIDSQESWQQLMREDLGFEIEEQVTVNVIYGVYLKGRPWGSLTKYQMELNKTTVQWEKLNTIPIAKHPFTKELLKKHGIYLGL